MTPDMSALIAKLEAANEGSRELDAEIWWACDRARAEGTYNTAALGMPKPFAADAPVPTCGLGGLVVIGKAPHYTTSLDAALSLLPEGWHVDCLTTGDLDVGSNNPARKPRCLLRPNLKNDDGWARHIDTATSAATPALALCIAALKSREAR